jgi:anti-anti-sigma factor
MSHGDGVPFQTRDSDTGTGWPSEESAEPFELELRRERDRVTVVPYGELDLATSPRLAAQLDALVAAGVTDIVLDLTRLTFMDSTGLNLVIRHSHRDGVGFRVIDGGQRVARVFDIAGARDGIRFTTARELDSEP